MPASHFGIWQASFMFIVFSQEIGTNYIKVDVRLTTDRGTFFQNFQLDDDDDLELVPQCQNTKFI